LKKENYGDKVDTLHERVVGNYIDQR